MLSVIFWIILIYFVILLSGRYLLPFLAKRFMNRMQKNFEQQFQTDSRTEYKKTKGEVSIEIPEQKEPIPDDLGEYTDFEEIK